MSPAQCALTAALWAVFHRMGARLLELTDQARQIARMGRTVGSVRIVGGLSYGISRFPAKMKTAPAPKQWEQYSYVI